MNTPERPASVVGLVNGLSEQHGCLQYLLDLQAVERVRKTWAWTRDYGDWEGLRACFHPDARVEVSWYSGGVDGFIEQSKANMEKRRPEERGKHWLGNMRCEIDGNRATLESDAQIQQRNYIDGYLLDCTSYARFYDLMEKRDGVWRISRWYCFFDKDRLEPVIPGSVPDSYFAEIEMKGRESGFAFMRFRQRRVGRTTVAHLILGQSSEEFEKKREGREWLAGS